MLQRIGRGLRLDTGKEEVIVVDFMDEHSRTLKNHSNARIKVWKEEGFTVVDATK